MSTPHLEPVPDPEPIPEEIRVDGTTQLVMLPTGGKMPGTATLSLSCPKITVAEGRAFRKGDVIHGEFVAVVRGWGEDDKADKATGIVVSSERSHRARITDVRLVAE